MEKNRLSPKGTSFFHPLLRVVVLPSWDCPSFLRNDAQSPVVIVIPTVAGFCSINTTNMTSNHFNYLIKSPPLPRRKNHIEKNAASFFRPSRRFLYIFIKFLDSDFQPWFLSSPQDSLEHRMISRCGRKKGWKIPLEFCVVGWLVWLVWYCFWGGLSTISAISHPWSQEFNW